MNKLQFNFTANDSLAHEMVMYLKLLYASMENKAFGELDVAEIITVDWDWFNDFHPVGNSVPLDENQTS